jgi:hypothetical protein
MAIVWLAHCPADRARQVFPDLRLLEKEGTSTTPGDDSSILEVSIKNKSVINR